MSKCLNNDSKKQMRLNIKQHRQKLLQYLENTNDTVLKPKIKLISNDIEKFNLNHNDKRKTRSSITVKQLQPNVKIKVEPLSNFELKLEPLPNIEIKDPELSPVIVKKLKEQIIEGELYYSSSSEEISDNISVKNTENFQSHNENDSNNSSIIIEEVKYDGQEQRSNDKSKEKYMYYGCDSDNLLLNINNPPTTKRKIMILKKKLRKPQDRDKYIAREQKCRNLVAKMFRILRKCCSCLNINSRVPSKLSILLAAKKECDLLTHYNKKILAEKIYWLKANEILKNRINELKIDEYK